VPVYEYACTECGEQLEVRQSFTDAPLTVCPTCAGRLRKVLSPVGVVFKGSGFYRTDSRAAAAGANGSGGDKGSDGKGSGDKDAKPDKAAKADSTSANGTSGSGSGSGTDSSGPAKTAGTSSKPSSTAKAGAS
jgi:putative FmdB family regulatory protein